MAPPVSEVKDLSRLPYSCRVERVHVVVNIGDRLAADFDDDVALLQARSVGWTAADDAAKPQALDVGRVVGNRAGEDSHTGPVWPPRRPLLDFCESWRLVEGGHAPSDRRRVRRDAIESFVVDLICGVARSMIVGVRASE